MTAWHERDDFWETMAPKIFGKLHWSVAPAEVDDIVALLEIPPGADVLDLCCGPGRHALELDSLLREAGFGSVKLFGDLKGRSYDQDAGRLVALARK